MESNNLRNKIGRILLALSFLVSIGLVSSTAVQAQWPWGQDRNDRRDRDRDYRRDRDRDYDRDRDSRRDRNRDYDRDRDWDNRNNRDYRRNDRYGRNGGYGGYGNVYQVALSEGYQDGLYTGSNDAQRGQNYNPQRSNSYRNGHGDNGGYGNNGRYGGGYQSEQAYREGFLRGYDEGFRRYGGYNNRRSNGNYGRRFPW